jgi:hypothetical protein
MVSLRWTHDQDRDQDLARLLADLRSLAFDKSLTDSQRAMAIRDRLREHAGEDFGDEDNGRGVER